MLRSRLIPTLLLRGQGLYKSVKFKNETYVGDPVNAVRIFNDKEVDELILLDIDATRSGNGPNFDLISEISSEAFMPICYGGGVNSLKHFEELFRIGIEKVAVNTNAIGEMRLIEEAARVFGSQSIVVGVDVRRSLIGRYERFTDGGSVNARIDPVGAALRAEEAGAGELLLYSIDRDGTMLGYDIPLIRSVTDQVRIPVIACGGAGKLEDMVRAIKEGRAASAAAGSFFIFHGKHRAVLITYPSERELFGLFDQSV